jgi:hypothetical protein
VDILFNPAINWYVGEGIAPAGTFDLQTVMIHELGHAHLLQHNNNEESVMYFQLNQSSTRRFLDNESDIQGGSTIVDRSVYEASVCSSNRMEFFNDTDCNHSLVNSVNQADKIKLAVAPNPSNGNISISGIEAGESFVVTDFSGRTVYTDTHTSSGLVNLNLTSLPTGVYILQVIGTTSSKTQKLVIH